MLANYPHVRLALYVGALIASVVLGAAALVAAIWDVRLGAALTGAATLIGGFSATVAATNLSPAVSSVRGSSTDLPQTDDPRS